MVSGLFKGNSEMGGATQLRLEIKTLEALSRDLFVGLGHILTLRSRVIQSRSYFGRVKNVAGCLMTVVCVYRILMASINVVLLRVVVLDPVSVALNRLCYILNIPIDVQSIAPYLSLILLGWLITLNIRSLFEKILTVFRVFTTSVSSNVFSILMTFIMGLYFSACSLLMRCYIPLQYRGGATEVLGPSLNFSTFHLLSDVLFVFASFVSVASVCFHHTTSFVKYKLN
eukprot:GHVR01133231.1.p1 GENE.GHVR01133231.1~~GHVR01133231.1.p1  ORF type:complete len:228 (+),score=25.54 GHVR01133231.1:605-1288(+)